MATNWKQTVNRINNERYRVPEGWETREQVAASLQCDPARVNDILKPGIASGDIERQEFPVWNSDRRMTTRVACYRLRPAGAAKAAEKDVPAKKRQNHPAAAVSRDRRILQAIENYPAETDRQISRRVSGATSSMVRELRARA